MLGGYRVIDADSHVMEPDGFWKERLSSDILARMPKPFYGGPDYLGNPAGTDMKETIHQEMERRTFANYGRYMFDPGWPPDIHLHFMDKMGIDVAFLYPSRGLHLWSHDGLDPLVASALAQAYNDWLYDHCSQNPERLRGVGGVSMQDPEVAVADLHKVVNRGFKGIFVRPNPLNQRLLGDPAYEPLWAECEAAGVGVGIHEATHTRLLSAGSDRFTSRFALHACCFPMENMMAFVALLEGGVFERHPSLRFAFLEAGGGWAPYWLWRLDDVEYKYTGFEVADAVKMKPSEYFRRQCYVSCEADEPYFPLLVNAIGEDNILFAGDFPHFDHTPDPARELIELEPELKERVVRKIFEQNPRAFYGF